MNRKQVEELGRIAWRHNPDHFYGNSFRVEMEGRRLVVVGTVKRHIRKNYRIVGILKRKR